MKTQLLSASLRASLLATTLLAPATLSQAQDNGREKPRVEGERGVKREGEVRRDLPRGEGDRRPEVDGRRAPAPGEGDRRPEADVRRAPAPGEGDRRPEGEARRDNKEGRAGEPERRIQQLMAAVENLRAAGMNELAENLARQAAEMRKHMTEGRGPGEPGVAPRGDRRPDAPPVPRGEVGDKPRGEGRGEPGVKPRGEAPAPRGEAPAVRGEPGREGVARRVDGPAFRGEGAPLPPAAELQNVIRQMREEMMEMQQAMRELRRQLEEKSKK